MAGTMQIVDFTTDDGTMGLNGVRPRWPEQWDYIYGFILKKGVSMESGLDGRNNGP